MEKYEFRVVMIGEGPLEKKLNCVIDNSRYKDKFFLSGFCKDYLSYLNYSDVFILNSKFEGLPGILIEAATTNIKIISRDCDFGPREILEGIDGCTLIDPDAKKELELEIEKSLVTNITIKRDISLMKKFFHDESMRAYEEVFKNIIGAQSRTWTGTKLPSRDFKSLVSTNSTTWALVNYNLIVIINPDYESKIWVTFDSFFDGIILPHADSGQWVISPT